LQVAHAQADEGGFDRPLGLLDQSGEGREPEPDDARIAVPIRRGKLSAIMPAISVLPEPVGASSSRQPLKAVAAARLASSPAWRNWLSA
jgi:hypothetical protein